MTTVEERPERVEQFKEEIASMRLRDPATARDRQLLWLGIGFMVIGVLVRVYAYTLSPRPTHAMPNRDAIFIALIGVAVAVVGSALFVRYSVAQFLRFWLARLSY